ncbi:MAG: F0F1 ATP synthase subunit C [Euryarchaeota archaeon]|nr:F0F1 ATP synthase subunit C [Euryarchaeota archaeon]
MLLVVTLVTLIAQGAAAEDAADNASTEAAWGKIAAGIALAGAALGTGLSQGQIGAAAVGMVAEDGKKFVTGLIFTALPETIVLFGFVSLFVL